MRALLPLLLLLGACAEAEDADHDGISPPDDCDDADPFVYPGAPDTPGDGVDSDCLDGDPPYAFLGEWELTGLTASYAGLYLFVEGTVTGELEAREDQTVDLQIAGSLNPDLLGGSYDITVVVAGTWSTIPGRDSFSLFAEGENFGEQMHVALDCQMEDDTLGCEGELKALEISLDAEATYIRG